MSGNKIAVFDSPVSSYAQKVRIGLREKGLPFESLSFFTPNGVSSDLTAANPRMEVPTLINGKDAIFDSTVILEYLEDLQPSPAILPPTSDPAARARVRMLEDVADTQYEAINWAWGEALFMGRAGDEGAPLREHLKKQVISQTNDMFDWLESKLGDAGGVGGDFFGGVHGFSVADIALAPLVNRSVYYGFGPKPGSKLADWFKRTSERPSVAETFREFADAVGTMYKMKDAFISGQRKREYRDHRLEFLIKAGGIQIVQDGIKNKNIRFSWPQPDGTQVE